MSFYFHSFFWGGVFWALSFWSFLITQEYTLRGVSNLDVTAPVALLEQLLATKFHVAVHAATERALVKAGDYEIPIHVEGSIATIFGKQRDRRAVCA